MDDFEKQMKQAFHVVIALFAVIAMALFFLMLLISWERHDSPKIVTREPVNNTYRLDYVSERS